MARSRQDGKLLWSGVLDAPPDVSASFLALLEETTFANVIGKKGKSLFKREDEFAKALQTRTEELRKLERPQLILQLLGKLEEIADIEPGYLAAPRDVEDLCAELAAKAVTLKREGDKKFEGYSLLDLVAFVMQEILTAIEEKFEKLDNLKQREVISELREFLTSLPEYQQRAFRGALGVDALSNEVIRQAIIKGTLGVGFSSVVSISGFAFYTAASSLLAGIAGLVGLTLPFAAYTTLSSGIAVLANPYTIVLVLLATVATAWWKGGQKIKQSLYPLIIVQLAAAAQPDKTAENRLQLESAVLTAWREAVKSNLDKQSILDARINEQKACQEELKAEQEKAKKLSEKRNELAKDINASWEKIRGIALVQVEAIQDGQWGKENRGLAQNIIEAKGKVDKSRDQSQQKGFLNGVAEKVAGVYDSWSASSKLDAALNALIVALKADREELSIQNAEVNLLLEHLQFVIDQIDEETKKQAENEDLITASEDRLTEAKEQTNEARTELRKVSNKYFGLGKAATDWPEIASIRGLPAVQENRLSKAFDQPLVPQTEEDRLRRLLTGGRGDSAFAGLVVGDFLYDYLRIDPLVMEGIDFARAANLSNPLIFSDFANGQAALMAEGGGDSIARLQGYVAERMVAQHMAAAGHDVSFPETSNQAGYDLLIDGQPFQVKCTESASYVREHPEKYPDIPVIVNREHAEEFADVQGVYIDPGLSVTEVTAVTEAGIAGGAEVLNFELPWIALAVSTAVEIRDLYYSRTGLTNSAINIATDTAGRTLLGAFSAKAGGVVGAVIFGPAGSVVGSLGGAVAGGIGGGRLAKLGRAFLVSKESETARAAARELAATAAASVPEKLSVWRGKRDQIAELVISDSEHRSEVEQIKEWLQQQMDNDARYFEQRQRELERIASGTDNVDPYDLSRRVLDLIGRAGIHPHKLQAKLRHLFSSLQDLGDAASRYRIGKPGTGESAT